jgi:cytochrome c peroxidase
VPIVLRAKRIVVVGFAAVTLAGEAAAQVPPLSDVAVPRPPNLAEFVRDEVAATVLGKALFWDMQVGSDGVQACATCHFRAGADPRRKNQISPGLLRVKIQQPGSVVVSDPDLDFDGQGPNYRLRSEAFPLRRLADPTDRASAIVADTNNVVSSQGVHHAIYGQDGWPDPDPDGFRVGQGVHAANVRRVEPRNTPTMINAVFNHRNFWDLRAQNLFNGVNPFGDRDPNAFVYSAEDPRNPHKVSVLLTDSSLASQAVGPPTNRFEMSADGRTFPDVGEALTRELSRRHRDTARRLRALRPLGKQLVHPDDGVLGRYSRWPLRGLKVDYESLIRRAFQPRWWNSSRLIRVAPDGTTTVVSQPDSDPTTDEFTLIEYNFSLFFGLAVQLYEATLVSADTPFDRFLRDEVNNPLSPAADRGRRVFFNMDQDPLPRGNCLFCHSGSLLSEASVDAVVAGGLTRLSNGQASDRGTRNIGVRETTDDLGNGGLDPFGNSLSVAVLDPPAGTSALAADGTFKIPGLRNVELTAPYFHNGGERTLRDVIVFYARGGNLGGASNPILTRDGTQIAPLSVLNFNTANRDAVIADLVAFLRSLTDERVRRAAAPFDHPQLFVPNGHPGDDNVVLQYGGQAVDSFLEIPATGRNGGPVLPGFLEN